jgi:sterol 3beta-glucosyltransferase
MQAEMKRGAETMAQLLPGLLKGSNLIITGMSVLGVFAIAEQLSIPILQAFLFPFTPTRYFPSPLVPSLPFGSMLNRLSFHITRQMFWQTSKSSDAAARQLLGLPKGSFWGPYKALSRSPLPVLHGYSAHVLPRPADWPENYIVTGAWFLDPPEEWTPPADLVTFLNAGPAPVYIGFGSMGSRDPEKTVQTVLEALERSGQRGVIASGWGGLKASALPENVHQLSSIPHTWLFPQMAAIVHHGGAGTTAAGTAAGVPSIIIPFMGDQSFWGRRIQTLGVGPQPIPRKMLTATNLANAIREAITNVEMRRSAEQLGQAVRAEDGVGNAVRLIETLLPIPSLA